MGSLLKDDRDELSELIGAIYAAGLDPTSWSGVLDRLERRGGDAYMHLGLVDPDPRRGASLGIRGLSSKAIDDYRSHFFKLNPWLRVSDRVVSGVAFDGSAYLPLEKVRETEFYADWLRFQPADCPIGVLAGAADAPRLCLSMVKPTADRQGIATAMASLQRLAPHLGRSMDVGRIAAVAAQRTLDARVLDALATGILYADGSGCVVYANAAAEDLLRLKDGIMVSGGRLAALRPEKSDGLLRLVRDAADPAADDAGAGGGPIALPRKNGLPALAVLVSPLSRGRAALFLRRPDESQRTRPDLAAILHLTATEAEVVTLLATGMNIEKIARQRRVSPVTVRNQIKSALQKTGTRRQSELLRLVWRASPDLR